MIAGLTYNEEWIFYCFLLCCIDVFAYILMSHSMIISYFYLPYLHVSNSALFFCPKYSGTLILPRRSFDTFCFFWIETIWVACKNRKTAVRQTKSGGWIQFHSVSFSLKSTMASKRPLSPWIFTDGSSSAMPCRIVVIYVYCGMFFLILVSVKILQISWLVYTIMIYGTYIISVLQTHANLHKMTRQQ